MIYNFRVQSSQAAIVRMGLKKIGIIDDVVAAAEKLALEANDYAIFDVHELQLKVIVRFHSRIIHVMTVDEAIRAKLPGWPGS